MLYNLKFSEVTLSKEVYAIPNGHSVYIFHYSFRFCRISCITKNIVILFKNSVLAQQHCIDQYISEA